MLVDEVRSKFELRGLGYRVNSTGGIIALVAGFGRIQKNSKSWCFGLPIRGDRALFYAASTPSTCKLAYVSGLPSASFRAQKGPVFMFSAF
jgi:hypothetical protein